MLDGTYATYIAQFDGQLAIYNIANSTIHRRVSVGLSTRFAFGLASPSPIVVPPEAAFARAFLAEHRVGTLLAEGHGLRSVLESEQVDFRRVWTESHTAWSAEGQSDSIQEFVRRLERRS
jgi:hypothetical protein